MSGVLEAERGGVDGLEAHSGGVGEHKADSGGVGEHKADNGGVDGHEADSGGIVEHKADNGGVDGHEADSAVESNANEVSQTLITLRFPCNPPDPIEDKKVKPIIDIVLGEQLVWNLFCFVF